MLLVSFLLEPYLLGALTPHETKTFDWVVPNLFPKSANERRRLMFMFTANGTLPMKRLLYSLAILMSVGNVPANAADVGVSVEVGEPGFYGRIEIGNFPRPQVIYRRPIVIERGPADVVRQPIYLRVPPGHAKHWQKHCGKYNACGQPVYFVQDRWYNEEYVPRYREYHGQGHGKHHGNAHSGEGGHGKAKRYRD